MTCNILYNLGVVSATLGKWEQAEDYCRESLNISRETDYKFFLTLNLVELGRIELQKGNEKQAQAFFNETLTLAPETDLNARAKALYGLSQIEAAHKRMEKAQEYARESLKIHEQIRFSTTNEIPEWVKQLEELAAETPQKGNTQKEH